MFILSRKIKYAFFLIGFILFISAVKGATVDSIIAKIVAANFYTQNYQVKNPSLSLVYTETSTEGIAEYYVYNVIPFNGFIIVSAEDAAHPVIGYSNERYYSTQNISPEFAFWMQHYKKQIAYIRVHNTKPTAIIKNEWTAYKNNLPVNSDHRVSGSVNPLLHTIWAQAPHYNYTCPGACVAGCIATAMAQIMKYWAYPPHGIGTNRYNDPPYDTLYANFDTTLYDWAAMPSNVTSNNPSVATLMYDCGVSVDMSYTPASSAATMITGDYPVCSQTAYVQYFGYNGSTIQGLYRSSYSDASWIALIENELNNGRPVQYAGQGNQGGHSWVCDGYNASGDFHMNWGWAGGYDAYFNVNALNPDAIPLDSAQEILIGIEPAGAVADFYANPLVVRAGDTVKFIDYSIGWAPVTAWQWAMPGSANISSTSQNPIVVYPTPGTYNVSETAGSIKGSNMLTRNNYITVLDNNTVNVYPAINVGTFTVQLHDGSLTKSNLVFSLYNELGQKVYTTTLTQYITPVSLFLQHGIYIYRSFDSSGKPVCTGKMVIM
jgi:PKD repeat protein